jgi:hypothetical protein
MDSLNFFNDPSLPPLEQLINEAKGLFSFTDADIEQGYRNADEIVNFVSYMMSVPKDDYKTKGMLMKTYYYAYFTGLVDDCFKQMESKGASPHVKDYSFSINPMILSPKCKYDMIEVLEPSLDKDKVWAYRTLYEVLNDSNASTREAQGGFK